MPTRRPAIPSQTLALELLDETSSNKICDSFNGLVTLISVLFLFQSGGLILAYATSRRRVVDRERAIVFKDVTVFDGQRIVPKRTVVIQGSKITAVGKAVVMLVLDGQQMPAFQFFDIGAEWKRFEFPFSSLGETDGTNITSLVIGAAQAPGPFKMQIDQVRLTRVPAAGEATRRERSEGSRYVTFLRFPAVRFPS